MFIYRLLFKINKVRYGRDLTLKGLPVVVNRGRISIGDNVCIKSSFLSNLAGLYQRTVICARTSEAVIRIGSDCGISGATIYARKHISIGDRTLIGANTKILDNDFHPVEAEARFRDDKDLIGTRPVKIGNDCFIGCNCLILKGTELGDGCVVGAGSVVTGKYPAGSVIGGNPAKLLRKV